MFLGGIKSIDYIALLLAIIAFLIVEVFKSNQVLPIKNKYILLINKSKQT